MNFISRWLSKAAGRHDIILSAMLMVAVFMMILPLPTALVDVLIAINLCLSIILLMIAIYIRDPLEFSVFPSLLLITTLYRLALTISTSRLILLQHDAGDIVYTFGNFVVGGNLVVGIIIFTIITIVQFIVITKGSERVAEVSARFSLDAMPGKQMSIDGDMRAGIIDAKEAKRQRAQVQKESQLYGAMDGAMKFVKGDAIASIIVIMTNILGGIAVGVMQHNMSASEAVNTYAVLSIGDGLIAQIPSLLISITAGLIVTRVPGEQRQNLANELVMQVGRQPSSLQMAGIVMFIFAFIPGFPFLVFASLGATTFAFSWWLTHKKSANEQGDGAHFSENSGAIERGGDSMSPGAVPLMLCLGADVPSQGVKDSLQRLRWQLFEQLGVPLPEIQLQIANKGNLGQCDVLLYQEPVLQLQLDPEESLLIESIATLPSRVETLPFSGEALHWIKGNVLEQAQSQDLPVYSGEQLPAYIVGKVIDRYAGEFIGVQETRYLMDAMEARYGELVKELQRLLSVGKVAEILQRLVEEGISIRDLRTIFETLVEWVPKEKDVIMLTEYVRIALRRHIRRKFATPQGWISVLMVGEGIENLIRESIRQSTAGSYSALDMEQSNLILSAIKAQLPPQQSCVLLTSLDVRRYLRKIVERELFTTPVLSFQELGDEAEIKVLGHVDLVGDALDAAMVS
ncbi:EscV/YscV/HrcV family type III secretion system export apparatus protein [Shewanella sp. VB17]|uniref:EscV/YscV/HrcV family type III secretion system export apparatus protein n=1 Tax=Shewanella sp. VB17 TaxID=2739432 RepID=UPI00156682FB|nr:EscV/YscV/HrcV family type III secretion system export apparatus protein [Shewanella sp. VB17]NRD74509.1 EscV/YscV/HrcV family type III secretion system export apparatus protein [Shewanella sp. VB17]